MKICFLLLLIGHFTSADYKCICDIAHSNIPIRECPADTAKVIGFMYASDDNDNFHGIHDTSEAHCKGLVPNIHPPPGWTAVYHFNQIGFIAVDAGDRVIPCSGHLNGGNWSISDHCSYLTSTPVITTPQTVNGITTAPLTPPKSTSTTAAPPTSPPKSTSTTAAPTTRPPKSTSTTARPTTRPPKSTSTTARPTTRPPKSTSTTATTTRLLKSTPTTAAPTTPTKSTTTVAPPTTPPKTTVTKATISTTTSIIVFPMCDKLGIVLDLGKHESIEHHSARPCDNGNFHSEALLMKHCGMPNPKNTTKGIRVLDHCQDIPLYTPISMFVGSQDLGLNAVFFRCENAHSMTIISQNCNVPKVETIDTQNGAELYYTIHWSGI